MLTLAQHTASYKIKLIESGLSIDIVEKAAANYNHDFYTNRLIHGGDLTSSYGLIRLGVVWDESKEGENFWLDVWSTLVDQALLPAADRHLETGTERDRKLFESRLVARGMEPTLATKVASNCRPTLVSSDSFYKDYMSNIVQECFIWESTPEGYEFWSDVVDILCSKEDEDEKDRAKTLRVEAEADRLDAKGMPTVYSPMVVSFHPEEAALQFISNMPVDTYFGLVVEKPDFKDGVSSGAIFRTTMLLSKKAAIELVKDLMASSLTPYGLIKLSLYTGTAHRRCLFIG